MKLDIIIKRLDNDRFDVHIGDKSADMLPFDEMLGVAAQLTVPENKRRLQRLKTKEQHEAFRNRNLKTEQ